MKSALNKKIIIFVLAATLFFGMLFMSACDRKKDANPYERDNNFVVRTVDTSDALEFHPVDFTPKYGVIFYVGALISPEHYAYLGEALAKQGYLAVIPKLDGNNAFNGYTLNEAAFYKYPSVKFFVGGHDLGGGAAVRRTMECSQYVQGVLLYVPTGFSKQMYNADGSMVYDDEGNPVWQHFTTATLPNPTLLLETDDALRTAELKQEAAAHINGTKTALHTLEASISSDFSTHSATEILNPQRSETVRLTLAFLKSVVV